jgi:hypothetical protein
MRSDIHVAGASAAMPLVNACKKFSKNQCLVENAILIASVINAGIRFFDLTDYSDAVGHTGDMQP